MIAQFTTDRVFWNDLLKESDFDFYHLPDYLQLESRLQGGEAVAFIYERNGSKALVPFVRRKIDMDGEAESYDLVSPYGYPGILVSRRFDYRLYNDVIATLKEVCNAEGIVSFFLRLHPALNNFLFNGSEHISHDVRGKTVYVDLEHDYALLTAAYSSNHRRNIKKLEKNGFTVSVDDWSRYGDWQQVYAETMTRLDASEYYFFDAVYFANLKESLQDRLQLIIILDDKGQIAAGGLFTSFNGLMQYHLGGTKEEYLSVAPTKMMFDAAIRWGKDNGQKVLHLGGGLGSNADSLFFFKYGFSRNTYQFSTLSCIASPRRYDELVRQKFEGRDDLDTDSIKYFPLYRYELPARIPDAAGNPQ